VNVLESFVQIMVLVAATALPTIGAIWLVAGRGAGREGFSGTGLFQQPGDRPAEAGQQ